MENKIIFKYVLIILMLAIIALCVGLIIDKIVLSKKEDTGYVETHMEYESDKNYIKSSDSSFVNDNPIIPTGYYRQQVDTDDDNIKIIYYIPEKYIEGYNNKINGNTNVKITTEVTDIQSNNYVEINDYLEFVIENYNDGYETISINKMECENELLDVVIIEYDEHTTYELIYTHNNKAYSLIYDISKKADANEIDIMKKVFASMKLVENIEEN